MKVVIAGSRTITSYFVVLNAISCCPWSNQITEVVSGRAVGVDRLGENWAWERKIPFTPFEITRQDWDRLGHYAGVARNKKMARYADRAIVIWDGASKGSENMIEEMEALNKPVWVWKVGR